VKNNIFDLLCYKKQKKKKSQQKINLLEKSKAKIIKEKNEKVIKVRKKIDDLAEILSNL